MSRHVSTCLDMSRTALEDDKRFSAARVSPRNCRIWSNSCASNDSGSSCNGLMGWWLVKLRYFMKSSILRFNWWETRGTLWHCGQDSAYIHYIHISIHIHIICQILSAITSHDGLDIAWYCHERPFRIGSSLALAPCSSRVVSYAEHTPAEASFPRPVE